MTGIIRSGTTWVGRVLETCKDTIYIHEPMNPQSPWNSCFPTPVAHYHLNENNGGNHVYLMKQLVKLEPVFHGKWRKDIAENRRNYIQNKTKQCKQTPQVIIKDPTALFSVDWINSTLQEKVVFVLRHPLSIIKSLLKLGWAENLNFTAIKNQPMLMNYFYSDLKNYDLNLVNTDWGKFKEVEKATYTVRFFYLAICKYYEMKNDYSFVSYEDFVKNPTKKYISLIKKLYLDPSETTHKNLKNISSYNKEKKHQNTSIPIVTTINNTYKNEYGIKDSRMLFEKNFIDIQDSLRDVVCWD